MNEALKSYKKAGIKQQEIKELVAVSCQFFTEVPSQNLKCSVK